MREPASKSAKALAVLLILGGVVGIGATANVFVGTAASGLTYGVNLVAVAALGWLLWRRPRLGDSQPA